jgi:DNA-binding NarL/FixJ family response regulator
MSVQEQAAVRVLVVDDSPVFRNILRALVVATPGFDVVGTAASGREALELVALLAPQLVLMDAHMPELDGVEAALRIRRGDPQVVVLLLTASKRAPVSDSSLAVGDKRDLSSEWLEDFWHRHGPCR